MMTSLKSGMLQPTFDYLPWQILHSLQICIHSLTTASGCRLFGSVVSALDFFIGQTGFDSHDRRDFFFYSYTSFLFYNFQAVRWGFVRDMTLFRRKWFRVIINGECYGLALLPSIICLGRFRIACRYIFTLWQLRQGVDSFAQWLEHCPGRPGFLSRQTGFESHDMREFFFSYASFLCYDFHVVRILNICYANLTLV